MKISTRWVKVVQATWVAAVSLLLLLNLDLFGYASEIGPEPKYWSLGVFFVTAVIFLPSIRLGKFMRRPLFWWVVSYFIVSVLWLGPSDNLESAREGLILVITTCLFVGAAMLAYPHVAQSAYFWTVVLWLALAIAVASVMQEYFNPSAYLYASAGQGIAGRAAGLYLNPNIAAQAIVMILACMMLRGSPKANLVAAILALSGLVLTFSRGGLVAWALLVVAATIQGRVPRFFLLGIALFAVTVLIAGGPLLGLLSDWIPPENKNSLDRLAWLLGQGGLDDFSAGEREFVAAYSWKQFLQAPFVGHGLGAMWVWDAGVGTHNLILRHLVEYGAIGALIFPLFLICAIHSTPNPKDRTWHWTVAAIVLLLSLFTHNMLEQAHFILPWLALTLMPDATVKRSVVRMKS